METIKRTGRKMDAAWRAAISAGKKQANRGLVTSAVYGGAKQSLMTARDVSKSVLSPFNSAVDKIRGPKTVRNLVNSGAKSVNRTVKNAARSLGAIGGAAVGAEGRFLKNVSKAPRAMVKAAKTAYTSTK